MEEKVNDAFQFGFNRISKLVKELHPTISDHELIILKRECKLLVGNIIHEIGNGTNALTHSIIE